MIRTNSIPRDPTNLADSVTGAENNDRITNSEEQHLVDDGVAETDVSTSPEKDEDGLSATDNDRIDNATNF